MLKVAIVGCGKIADSHAFEIRRVGGAELVAVCDAEPLMARQLAERFRVGRSFTDLDELLHEARPDVVHVTTPAESHFRIATSCLRHGCHVYVEKPFTLNHADALRLIELAAEKNVKLTAGHDAQFTHAARRMRALVQDGYLGGPPMHMDSYYCYELGNSAYVRALLTDEQHWVRRLPGKLLHNIISHGIAKLAEFLDSDAPLVIAHGHVSPTLRSMGETVLIDELRVIISDENRTTAYFTFSSQMRPSLHQLRLYGPQNGLILDQDQETLTKLRGDRFKSYLEKFVPPVIFASQYLDNLVKNARAFLVRDFHMTAGMHYLIKAFYESITDETPPPIPYREILRTAMIMDEIFVQLESNSIRFQPQRGDVGSGGSDEEDTLNSRGQWEIARSSSP